MGRKSLSILAILMLIACAACGGGSGFTANDDAVYRSSSFTEASPFSTDLIAGAGQGWKDTGTDVGDVFVWDDGTTITVQYLLDSNWEWAGSSVDGDGKTHLYVSNTAPTAFVGKAPGQYPYCDEDAVFATDGTTKTATFAISGIDLTSNVYIIAHAAVKEIISIEDNTPGYYTWETDEYGSGIVYAGQNKPAGTFDITTDGTNLSVTVDMNSGWKMGRVYFWFDDDASTLPLNKQKNPLWGKFPYIYPDPALYFNPLADTYTFSVPMFPTLDPAHWSTGGVDQTVCFSPIFACLHVAAIELNADGSVPYNPLTGKMVVQTGIGRNGNDHDMGGDNWATYFDFSICKVWHEPQPGNFTYGNHETAFAFDIDNIHEEFVADEYGWFRHFFDGTWVYSGKNNVNYRWDPNVGRWGWVFGYPNALSDPDGNQSYGNTPADGDGF